MRHVQAEVITLIHVQHIYYGPKCMFALSSVYLLCKVQTHVNWNWERLLSIILCVIIVDYSLGLRTTLSKFEVHSSNLFTQKQN